MQEVAGAVKKVSNIIEKVFGPQWQKKKADAEAYSINTIAKTIRENDDMKITYSDGAVVIEKKECVRLLDNAINREKMEMVQQQQNLEAMLEHALEELKEVKNISDEPVDEDFVDRLVENAKRANKKELQYLWGKILAREIIKPGSFSMRTLEVVKNLSKKDFDIFLRVSKCMIGDDYYTFLLAAPSYLEKFEAPYADILLLSECGLINSSIHTWVVEVNDIEHNALYNKDKIVLFRKKIAGSIELKISNYGLTKVGIELYKLLDTDSNEECFKGYINYIARKNTELEFEVHQIIDIDEHSKVIYEKTAIKDYIN